MKILVADDHQVNRRLLRLLLEEEGFQIVEASDGQQALTALNTLMEPCVGLIDWEMPELEGPEVCRQARLRQDGPPLFLSLITVRNSQVDIVTGLKAGANDYIVKPFHKDELLARVKIGVQMVELQQSLLDRVRELGDALASVKTLSGLLPICGYCKKIRNDRDYWQQVEEYLSKRSEVKFSHGICPECYQIHIQPQLDELRRNL
jgi:DNA-binding response OmpR family regulator